MKTTIKTIVMTTLSGFAAWQCGETSTTNFPLCMFFGIVSIGCLMAVFFEFMRNEGAL